MQKYRPVNRPRQGVLNRGGGVAPADAGYTLIEVMIALMILTIGILGIWSMQGTAIRGNAQAKRITEISALASEKVEELMRMPYTPDPDDGSMDAGTYTQTEGAYTVEWDISAADVPINNMKTITVTASWAVAGQTRNRVSYVYYKADQM